MGKMEDCCCGKCGNGVMAACLEHSKEHKDRCCRDKSSKINLTKIKKAKEEMP